MSNADVSKQRNFSADIDRATPYDPIERSRYDGSVRMAGPGGRTPSVAETRLSQLSARERKRRILNNQGNPFEANDGVS